MSIRTVIALLLLPLAIGCATASTQSAPVTTNTVGCVENSPERRGGTGCTILVDMPLPDPLTGPVWWHIERFATLAAAQAAAPPAGTAAEGHGAAWLFTVSSDPSARFGGTQVASVGPMPLPEPGRYAMQLFSAQFPPGLASRVHTHPGPEAFYVVSGEQCLETPSAAARTKAGESHVIAAGAAMRVVATGASVRRAFAVVVHPQGHAGTHTVSEPPPLRSCR